MKITLTKTQYKSLLKLVYLGNWMINAIRAEDEVKKYTRLEQYIFSFAKDFGFEKYIEYDSEYKQFFPTRDLEEDAEIEQFRAEYDDVNFWEELSHRLSERDFFEKYTTAEIEKMDLFEQFEKQHALVDKYSQEFEKHGLDRMDIIKGN